MKHAILIAAILFTATARAGNFYGPYAAEVVRVIDGDTIVLDVDVWPELVQRISLRLDGVDTPEKRGSPDCEKVLAEQASRFTEQWLNQQGSLSVSGVFLGKFAGRAIGKISLDGKDLGEALVAAGFARRYNGGKRESWCLD